jgi:hypothetical protein
MAYITLPVGSTISINSNLLTEHNRQPISISTNRIEQITRMSNGTARKFFIADKLTVSASWNKLPSRSTFTVDGKYGALDIKDLYDSSNGQGTVTVIIKHANDTALYTKTMYFSSCSLELVGRNAKLSPTDTPQDLWNLNISLEEV